ncbi:helix-turn-helix domain-containing protein [Yinghuangia aomiensis]|uniref:Helix-turn-helix domain-containing protein n=2 Tax=Yinghuangia aomiensis TaxID=676205 RepID=A0ABP9I1D9_9ACTN
MDTLTAVAAVRGLLDLLLREADPAELEAAVGRLRAAGADAAVLAEADAAYASALRLRDVLRESRRREAELAALNETAGDLAALRGEDEILRAIVQRARSLLATDTAYLSLDDPAVGDTYLRVTAGVVSPRFRRVRMAAGEGIGGLVAARGTPFTTADYFADDSFRHTRGLDDDVRDEGLVAMLAVPLLAGDRVIGVLWASDRRTRVFGAHEVSLLASLAAHAAVAIGNAALLADTRAAVADLAEANERSRRHGDSVERAAAAHDRLTGLVLAGSGVGQVVETVAELVAGEVVLLLGETPDTAEIRTEEPDFAAANEQATATGRAARAGCVDVVPVVAGTERLGLLVRRGADSAASAASDTRILERAAMIVALLLLFRRSVAEAEHRQASELVHDLIDGTARDRAALADRAARLGADLAQPHAVVVADAPGADRSRLASAAGHLAATAGGLAGEVDGHTVLLLPRMAAAAAARRTAAEIGTALGRPVTAGAAGPVADAAAPAAAYTEARRCLAALYALGRGGEGAAADELGFVGLLLANTKDVPGFVQDALGPLLAYDRARGTELTRTVEAYFAAGRSVARTGETLHIHVNTVAQRLDRITALLGAEWRDAGRELQVRLALHLWRLLPE